MASLCHANRAVDLNSDAITECHIARGVEGAAELLKRNATIILAP